MNYTDYNNVVSEDPPFCMPNPRYIVVLGDVIQPFIDLVNEGSPHRCIEREKSWCHLYTNRISFEAVNTLLHKSFLFSVLSMKL